MSTNPTTKSDAKVLEVKGQIVTCATLGAYHNLFEEKELPTHQGAEKKSF
jgi:hypothetical protein